MLTREQGNAVLDRLNQAVAAAAQRASENRAEGESGIIAGVLGFFDHALVIGSSGISITDDGGFSHTSQLDALVGAVNIVSSAVARLQSDLPAAVDDPAAGARWLDAAKVAAQELQSMQTDISEATIEDTLAKTATATGTQIKQGADIVAGDALRFTWSAIPWWVLVGGALVLGGYGYLQVRRLV